MSRKMSWLQIEMWITLTTKYCDVSVCNKWQTINTESNYLQQHIILVQLSCVQHSTIDIRSGWYMVEEKYSITQTFGVKHKKPKS